MPETTARARSRPIAVSSKVLRAPRFNCQAVKVAIATNRPAPPVLGVHRRRAVGAVSLDKSYRRGITLKISTFGINAKIFGGGRVGAVCLGWAAF